MVVRINIYDPTIARWDARAGPRARGRCRRAVLSFQTRSGMLIESWHRRAAEGGARARRARGSCGCENEYMLRFSLTKLERKAIATRGRRSGNGNEGKSANPTTRHDEMCNVSNAIRSVLTNCVLRQLFAYYAIQFDRVCVCR